MAEICVRGKGPHRDFSAYTDLKAGHRGPICRPPIMSVMSRYGLDRRIVRQADPALALEPQRCNYCDGSSLGPAKADFGTDRPKNERLSASARRPTWLGAEMRSGTPCLSAVDNDKEGAVSEPPSLFVAFKEAPVDQAREQDGVYGAFLRELLFELGEHARRGGTAYGAAVVAKRVALTYGVVRADRVRLPRPTRLEREAVLDRDYRG
jgi:hypothetical protein